MPRRPITGRREPQPDPKFGDKLVGRFINALMRKGKKSIAESVCYKAFDIIQEKLKEDPLKVFKSAVENIRPVVEVKSRRVGGASYQVPVDIRPMRRTALAFRWLVQYAALRSGKSMPEKIAFEIVDAANRTGGAMKKREDTHKMAEANKAFAHYRW